MEYVMVPVPEEHVIDVMQHVARLVARASVVPWDAEAVGIFFDEVDEASRSVLSLAARATIASRELSDDDASTTLELSSREVRAIVRDLQETSQREKREPIVGLRETAVTLPNGRTVQKRIFVMTEDLAKAIRAHEKSSARDLPPGLAPDG